MKEQRLRKHECPFIAEAVWVMKTSRELCLGEREWWEVEQKEDEIKETETKGDSKQYGFPACQGGKIEDGGYH